MYLLRRDVKKYSENVPLDGDSPLWPLLKNVLQPHWGTSRRYDAHWRLIQQAVQPECRSAQGQRVQARGIPTGAPIAPPLLNLYLTPLDRELATIPAAFYARYGDDFLFAHPDAEIVRRADRRIDEVLASLRLAAHRGKNCSLYLNGAGRHSSDWCDAAGATSVSFLGCIVRFDGTVSLTSPKTRELLQDLSRRARRTRRALSKADRCELGRAVCATINRALDPKATGCHRTALPLRRIVTDRGQLKQLDYQIARLVLRTITGDASVRAFRTHSYHELRSAWQLESLCVRRNRCGRAREQRPWAV